MGQTEENLVVVLDVGSAETRVLAGDVNEGALRYRGHATLPSAGMRKGMIADLGPAAKVVKSAVEKAELAARVNIDACVIGVGGPHVRGVNLNGGFDPLGADARDYARGCEDRRRNGAGGGKAR